MLQIWGCMKLTTALEDWGSRDIESPRDMLTASPGTLLNKKRKYLLSLIIETIILFYILESIIQKTKTEVPVMASGTQFPLVTEQS